MSELTYEMDLSGGKKNVGFYQIGKILGINFSKGQTGNGCIQAAVAEPLEECGIISAANFCKSNISIGHEIFKKTCKNSFVMQPYGQISQILQFIDLNTFSGKNTPPVSGNTLFVKLVTPGTFPGVSYRRNNIHPARLHPCQALDPGSLLVDDVPVFLLGNIF